MAHVPHQRRLTLDATEDLTRHHPAPAGWRRRAIYVGLALATICAGLVVHRPGTLRDPVMRDVTGDALWGMMIAWWAGALVPQASLVARGLAAYGVCAIVEASQAVHAPALDAIRATTAGHLVLGSGFDPRDFVAYAAGVAAALLIEAVARRFR